MKKQSLLKAGYQLTRFLNKLTKRPKSVLILTHDYPDPDALASAFCLHYLLKKAYHIASRMVFGGIIGRMENRTMVRLLKIPIHRLKPSDLKKYKEVCLVDTQPDFKNNSFPKNRKAFLVLDQHPSIKKPNADCAIVDTDCGATCVILAEACLLLELEFPAPVATALAYGILTDTQNLYRLRRRDVIQTYLSVLTKTDMRLLARMQNPPLSRHFFQTLASGIGRAKVNRFLIFSHLGGVHNPDTAAQIADLLLSYQGMRVAFCTGRYQGRLHLSLRVKEGSLEANDILRSILEKGEAGGHDTIAGGSFKVAGGEKEKAWRKAEEEILRKLIKKLKIRHEHFRAF
ncbi:MAG: DHH family phosphoesterase [Deltaproteobacteria bacterium]|nr:DHH family phosphoesterase [Deltaproteobacteria bacterium]